MKLSMTLQTKIVDFFRSLPNIHDPEGQQAFIYHIGFEPQLQDQIPIGKSPAQFVPLLVSMLLKYGKLDNGRFALEVALEAAKSYVGQDKQAYCDSLIQELHDSLSGEPNDSNVIPKIQKVNSHSIHYKTFFSFLIVVVIIAIIYIIQVYKQQIATKDLQPIFKNTTTPQIEQNDSQAIQGEPPLSNLLILTSGYGPTRNGLSHPNTTPNPSFNNYIDGLNILYKDERYFSTVSKDDFSNIGDKLIVDTSEIYVIFHNYLNNAGNNNAEGVRIYTDSFYQNNKGDFVTPPFINSFDVIHYIKGNNTIPPVIWDTATIISHYRVPILRLRFIPNKTAMWITAEAIGHDTMIPVESQTDFFRHGIPVGSKDSPLEGIFKPGDDQRVVFNYFTLIEYAKADLSLDISADHETMTLHQLVNFTCKFRNDGPTEAIGVIMSHDYDETKLSIDQGSIPSICEDTQGELICKIKQEVPSNSYGTLSYSARAIAIGQASNEVYISSDMMDFASSNYGHIVINITER